MTQTIPGPDRDPGNGPPAPAARPRTTRTERATVLAGVTIAAICTASSAFLGVAMDFAGALWLAVIAWTVVSSLALALRRGIRHGDWSAFRRRRLPDGRDERIDAATESGQYAHLSVAEEHERLMRD